jgi:asparagine synthase (glutamine-hydrolysing)
MDMLMLTGGCANLTQSLFKDKKSFDAFLKNILIKSFPAKQQGIPFLYTNMHFDLQVYVPDLLLYTLDQLTMASTVEGRVPLLNTEFIRASYNLHPDMHVTATKTRLMMREMAKGRLDPQTFLAKKQGFSGPVRHWVSNNEKLFKERVMAVREIPFLEGLKVDHYWNKENQEDSLLRSEIFTLFCLSTWYQNKKNE